MPNAIAWRTVCTELKDTDVLIIIECLKAFKIGKSQAIFCTLAQKDFTKQIGMEAARIHTAMLLHFGLRPSQLPALQKVQNVVCYYRRTKLGGNDTTAAIVEAVQRLAFNAGEEEHDPFTFGWDVDREGKLVVGNGSDEKSFLVGFSTKALLHQASRDPSTVIFHVDATYKTNQQQECHYAKAFAAIRWIYSKVLGEQFRVAYEMGTLMLPRTILLL
ncbi:hypothetical protein AM587_10001370 [Phytophthora nicotianae]|uniref:Uncharacterized protein n=1 Tax=Phytophthora nicotianae TaxID=4792 RepID=A0A0W8CNK3_PHYNI|nr:hypothetical protein AM587_10001370 [Phytophthora nicotianae]